MIRYIVSRVREAAEILMDKGPAFFLKRFIYRDLELVLTEKDLDSLGEYKEPLLEDGLMLVDIDRELLTRPGLVYPVKSEYHRALGYLGKGYKGVALIRGDEVGGFIWYTMIDCANQDANHPDVRLLGIASEKNSSYMFSMLLNPKIRGKNLAGLLQTSVFKRLREQGVDKAYGTYETKNIPALWVHRSLKWNEIGKFSLSQFIFIKKAVKI